MDVLRILLVGSILCGPACATLDAPRKPDLPPIVRPASAADVAAAQPVPETQDVQGGFGSALDLGHDWLYRHLERGLMAIDLHFAPSGEAPLVMPPAPLRVIDLTDFVHTRSGMKVVETPDLDADLSLPNLERRLRLVVTSADVQESPGDPEVERPAWRAGLNFAPAPHVDFEIGARMKLWPSAFASFKWTPVIATTAIRIAPFVKPYVESGIGLGVSAGVAVEYWRDGWFVRSASYADWVRNTGQTAWQQTFLAGRAQALIATRRYDRLVSGNDLACGFAALMSVGGDRWSRTTTYEAGLMLKRRLHEGWLYGYAEPFVNWNRSEDWHPDIGLRIGFDALLWGPASASRNYAAYCP